MSDLPDLIKQAKELGVLPDGFERTGAPTQVDTALLLTALIAAEKRAKDRERCGNCKRAYWHKSMCEARANNASALEGEIAPSDRCHFEQSRWELCE